MVRRFALLVLTAYRMKKQRLFVAATLPPGLHDRLAASLPLIRTSDAKASVVTAENLHCTIRFIGDVDRSLASDIGDLFEQLFPGPLSLTPGAYRFLGAGTLVLETSANDAFRRYVRRLESALINLGLEPAGRRWQPHITLARRVRRDAIDFSALPVINGEQSIQAVVLFLSEFTANGMRYTPLLTTAVPAPA